MEGTQTLDLRKLSGDHLVESWAKARRIEGSYKRGKLEDTQGFEAVEENIHRIDRWEGDLYPTA